MRSRLGSLPTLALVAAALAGVLSHTVCRSALAANSRPAEQERNSADADDEGKPTAAHRQVLSVGNGDTLMDMLTGADVPADEATNAIAALRKVYDPRKLQVGQRVTVLFEPRRGGSKRFVGLEFVPDVVRSVSVSRKGDSDFTSNEVEKAVTRQPVAAQAVIRSSLFEAGSAANVPVSVMMALIKDYSYDIDFQRDLQPGDRFEVLYERLVTADGKVAGEGDILYAALVLSGEEFPIFRHKSRDGRIDYYNREGESIRRALLRTPIDGARITSGFGMRHHPILGFSKMHKGMDFGAPTGTPIFAAGSGVVEEVGPHGGYGNYIRIRHNTQISTAYAHLSRIAKGTKRGARIDQGDVIGYVGTTGRSTGPHLHYEVLKAGQQVNPKSVDLPTGEKLAGRELQAFEQTVRSVEKSFEQARSGMQLAKSPGSHDDKSCTKATTC
ncbi:murein DD-endopeptidase MepM/ murein hydrolase activator NlpD [Azospirillum rugosum]|uniref:Murein DD-endopeptidase MepM/ murein hydrolase activator NlpD n=1 Tax=Azospirillum rugosum TaxID=416170 RepID=A0ABS4SUU3_9PROT|nr:murein DD-endopeptidase MepM/ murein hydrolase activator NlpD [Azospirillum rugosum]MDQ0529855.1 murein DD-endopeptidase MepM/ murein hydrolase activator NlpD [Azospirillum rugosum]